jgi:hypothetical protein
LRKGSEKLAFAYGAGLNRIVKYNDFERCVWAGAHELEQSLPARIGTSQLVLAIASANMPVFHNGENIAGVDRLAIGMIGMARDGSDEVSTNQLPIFQARVFCRGKCDSRIVHYIHKGTLG